MERKQDVVPPVVVHVEAQCPEHFRVLCTCDKTAAADPKPGCGCLGPSWNSQDAAERELDRHCQVMAHEGVILRIGP